MATCEEVRKRPQTTAPALKNEANEYLQRASNLERNHQFDEASVLYKRVVSLISSHESTPAVDSELLSMKRNANNLLLRSSLRNNQTPDSNITYRSMVKQLSNHVPKNANAQEAVDMSEQVFQDPSAFQRINNEKSQEKGNATVLLQLDMGAKMFYLAKDGSIKTTSETLPLTVFQMMQGGEPSGLLKLGTWIYPLHPRVSPSFKTGYDAYIFPNNTTIGEFVGLMFDETITPDVRNYFENILSKYSVFMAQPGTPTYGESLTATTTRTNANTKADIIGRDEVLAEEASPYDTTRKTGKIAAALVTGTQFLTKQLATGVVKAESLIGYVSKNVQDKMVPNSEPVKINRGIHVTARGLRSTSEVAVKASSFVVTKVGDMTHDLARTFAPNFGKSKKLPDGTVEEAKFGGIMSIGHAGLASFGIIFESCENAAKHLATNLANESIGVVKYKYGDDASILTENAAYAIGNTALTVYYISELGPKAIAKNVVKQTAKQTAKNALK